MEQPLQHSAGKEVFCVQAVRQKDEESQQATGERLAAQRDLEEQLATERSINLDLQVMPALTDFNLADFSEAVVGCICPECRSCVTCRFSGETGSTEGQKGRVEAAGV